MRLVQNSLVLFIVFSRYGNASVPDEEGPRQWNTAVTVGWVCVLHGLLVITLTCVFAFGLPRQLTGWANFLGVMAAALAAVQYIPQIWTTYHLAKVGSLSIPMMLMQTPGGFLFAFNLYRRLGPEGWSTWGIYLLTASMQGVLLGMSIYYESKNRAAEDHAQQQQQYSDEYPPEEPALLPSRPNVIRTYSEGWHDGLPGPYTAHPERYADTEEELERLREREERQVLREDRPLLRPGGIGTPRNYHTYDDDY